jgi:hypothetical protein
VYALSAEHVSGIREHVSSPTSAGGFGDNTLAFTPGVDGE